MEGEELGNPRNQEVVLTVWDELYNENMRS